MENRPHQLSTDPFAVQLNGELRWVIKSLLLLKELLFFEKGASSDPQELAHDKYLTVLLQDKQATMKTTLEGLTNSFKALSTAVNDGRMNSLNDAMRSADRSLSNLKAVVIGVQELLKEEYRNVKAIKRRQGWNFLLAIVLGAGMGWVKVMLSNDDSLIYPSNASQGNNVSSIPSQSNNNSAASTTPSILDLGPVSDTNGFLYHHLFGRWTAIGFVACVTIYAQQAFSSYCNLHRRTELLRRHESDTARVVEVFNETCEDVDLKQNDDKGKLEAFTLRSLRASYQFSAEGKMIVMRDCADIEAIIQSIRDCVST